MLSCAAEKHPSRRHLVLVRRHIVPKFLASASAQDTSWYISWYSVAYWHIDRCVSVTWEQARGWSASRSVRVEE